MVDDLSDQRVLRFLRGQAAHPFELATVLLQRLLEIHSHMRELLVGLLDALLPRVHVVHLGFELGLLPGQPVLGPLDLFPPGANVLVGVPTHARDLLLDLEQGLTDFDLRLAFRVGYQLGSPGFRRDHAPRHDGVPGGQTDPDAHGQRTKCRHHHQNRTHLACPPRFRKAKGRARGRLGRRSLFGRDGTRKRGASSRAAGPLPRSYGQDSGLPKSWSRGLVRTAWFVDSASQIHNVRPRRAGCNRAAMPLRGPRPERNREKGHGAGPPGQPPGPGRGRIPAAPAVRTAAEMPSRARPQ